MDPSTNRRSLIPGGYLANAKSQTNGESVRIATGIVTEKVLTELCYTVTNYVNVYQVVTHLLVHGLHTDH